MEYRRALPDDFEQIVDLQNKNLVSVLSPSEQADGFLSAAFSVEQFKSMNDDLCVVVCVDAGKVCGYACVSSIEYNKNFPLLAAMIERFAHIRYQHKLVSAYKSAVYGPACVDKNYRGKGILFGLFQKMQELLLSGSQRLELLTTLISTENERSLNAHKKLGMETIGQFKFNEHIFEILAYPLS